MAGFSQDDVDAMSVFYRTRLPADSWSLEDEFIYEVTTPWAQPISFKKLKVDVSFANVNRNNIARLVNVYRGSVDEGGELTLSSDHINMAPLQNLLRQTYLAHSRAR